MSAALQENMIILHLESATKVCSVALTKGSELLAVKESKEGNKHSKWMTSYIDDVLQECGIGYDELDAIAIGQGPGSYTGLRVAYSVAKGLAYARSIKLIEVDTLTAMATAYIYAHDITDSETVILPMIDARRMEVYTKAIEASGTEITALHAHILDSASFDPYIRYEKIICIGDGAFKVEELELDDRYRQRITIESNFECSAAHLRFSAVESYQNGQFADLAYCVPSYLKSPNITTPRKKILG